MEKKTKTPIRVGNNVIVRSVTHYYTGKIEALDKDSIVLSACSWIADTGRWANALATGKLSEVEPYPDGTLVAVGRGAVVDVADWKHELPRATQ